MRLYYAHDPMCSWCWGFAPRWEALQAALPPQVEIVRLLGGLAPDNPEPMDDAMREYLNKTWRHIQERIPGTRFNFAFWAHNTPRRSTYPACRAVLVAREMNPALESAMIRAIQQAYYLEARNPSDEATLIELAAGLGLDAEHFGARLNADDTRERLLHEIHEARALGLTSFPGLLLEANDRRTPIPINYTDVEPMRSAIVSAC